MSRLLDGYYWKTGENEIKVQISYEAKNENMITEMFSEWQKIAEGIDNKRKRNILIFKKSFADRRNFSKFVDSLNDKILNLKEAL